MSTKTGVGPRFEFFTGDVNWLDYGGVWARKVGPRRFHFIRLDNMDEACGRDNEGHPKYSVELEEVDLDDVPPERVQRAMYSCGLEPFDDNPIGDCAVADCVRSYGLAAPLHSVATNNAHKGIAECRKESYRLTADQEAYEEAMNRLVNKIGSTAREYGRGDIQSALVRGIQAGDKDAVLIGKMYQSTGGQTLGGKIDVQPITDALARRD